LISPSNPSKRLGVRLKETDFVLSFTQAADQQCTLRSYAAQPLPPRRNGRGEMIEDPWSAHPLTYFMASIAPEPGKPIPNEPSGTDVLILADTSSGTRDQEAVRQTAAMIVHNLRDGDRFRLMDVALRATVLWFG
jgi:hypothetical protein